MHRGGARFTVHGLPAAPAKFMHIPITTSGASRHSQNPVPRTLYIEPREAHPGVSRTPLIRPPGTFSHGEKGVFKFPLYLRERVAGGRVRGSANQQTARLQTQNPVPRTLNLGAKRPPASAELPSSALRAPSPTGRRGFLNSPSTSGRGWPEAG
jgi:hypothetical protein